MILQKQGQLNTKLAREFFDYEVKEWRKQLLPIYEATKKSPETVPDTLECVATGMQMLTKQGIGRS